jgi:hypothetical protein
MTAPDCLPDRMPEPAGAPSLSIVVTLEDPTPRLRSACRTEAEADRLEAWIRSRPRLLRLMRDALEIAAEERAA